MGSFNIESGENALTPRLNIGEEHRAHDPLAKREKEKAKDSKEWLTCSIESRPEERNHDFSLEIPREIPVYFACLLDFYKRASLENWQIKFSL